MNNIIHPSQNLDIFLEKMKPLHRLILLKTQCLHVGLVAGDKILYFRTPYCSEIWSKMGIYYRCYKIIIHPSQNLDIFLEKMKPLHRLILLETQCVHVGLVAGDKILYFRTPYCSEIWSKVGTYRPLFMVDLKLTQNLDIFLEKLKSFHHLISMKNINIHIALVAGRKIFTLGAP